MDLEVIMDMRRLPGDPAEAWFFDWERFLLDGEHEELVMEIQVHETRLKEGEPGAWRKAPCLGHWRFPPG